MVKTLEDQPVLHRHLQWIWQAFTDLNYRRGATMSGPLPINYTDIESYCRLKGIWSLIERQRLLRHLDTLDRQWMAKKYEEKPTGTKSPETKKPPPRQKRERG